MTRRFETAQQYKDWLIKTSEAGNFPSVVVRDGQTHCCYRSPNGRMCAAGILIPDEFYHASMEGNTADKIIKMEWYPDGLSKNTLCSCQFIHDDIATSLRGWDHAEFVRRIEKVF